MSAAADFAERFAAYWRAPSVEGLDALLAPDVQLVAPMTPTTEGLDAGKQVFATLFRLIPDLTGVVHRWGPTEDGLLVEFTLSGTVGGAAVSWDAVDRFVLREDGLATVRVNYFDSARLIGTLARRPRAWPALLRSRLGR
jgi:ketosteroid isomerase-like protein